MGTRLLVWVGFWAVCFSANGQTLKLNGSTTVNPVVVDAAQIFQKKGWKILVDTHGGSSGGISYVAEGRVDIGMASRLVNDQDRQKHPKAKFVGRTIGYDGVALVVSKSLFDRGVQSLTLDQIRGIYEGKIKNWKAVGGPDQKVVFFNKEPGRGTWEVFANYVYGKADKAPKVFHPEVGANQEARTKVSNHPGAVTQLSASWAWDFPKVKALALVDNKGKKIEPTLKNIENDSYPMRRPLLLYTNGAAQGAAKTFIEYLLGPEGQKLLTKHGYLPLSAGAG